jgi:hypothetical protein
VASVTPGVLVLALFTEEVRGHFYSARDYKGKAV